MCSGIVKEYKLKDSKVLCLKEDAILHIINGCYSTKPIGGKQVVKVLTGGLHTFDGWVNFKTEYSSVLEHLHFYDNSVHKFWYYSRELSNGVIVVRIPKELFSGKAAKMTMYPDDYYKSGYLWKTLFPKGYDRLRIISSIEEAILNEDESQRQKGQIVGYINNSDPNNKIKVVIQYRGKDIHSVYPAWTQPNLGNNGKPYSHFDNIGFVISESTEYFNDVDKKEIEPVFLFSGDEVLKEQLHENTPKLFTDRVAPDVSEMPSEWRKKRDEILRSSSLTDEENDILYKYLNDFNLTKYYPEITTGVYTYALNMIDSNQAVFNSYQIVQNFIDGLKFFYYKEEIDKVLCIIENYMTNMVSHTLFDLVLKKSLLSAIICIVSDSKSPELSYKFIKILSRSPIRRELYIEYNLDSILKKKLSVPVDEFPMELLVVSNPNIDMKLEYEDFIEMLKELVGETYTLNFSDSNLNNILDENVRYLSDNIKRQVVDSLNYLDATCFVSLSEKIGIILKAACKYENKNVESLSTSVGLILRDYSRIQFAQRQRVNARYINYYDHAGDMYLPLDHNLLFGLVLKHERWINSLKSEIFVQAVIDFSTLISDCGLKNDANNFMKKIGKEKPPLPEFN